MLNLESEVDADQAVECCEASKINRYILFAIGLFVMSLGVALSTRCHLGTSPISSSPYVLSLGFSWSMGRITMVVNILFVVLQVLILRSRYEPFQLFQVLVAVAFGYFTDIGLHLVSGLNPSTYLAQWLWILMSCVVVAFGIYLEITANVLMMSGEGLVSAISRVLGIEFGKVKICFDVTLVMLAIVFSLCLFGRLRGVREGTIVAAILVGNLVRVFRRLFNPWVTRVLA